MHRPEPLCAFAFRWRGVTGHLGLSYLKPTPMGVELLLKARVEGELGRKTRVICEVWAGDVLTVTADSVFVRVVGAVASYLVTPFALIVLRLVQTDQRARRLDLW